MLTINKENTYSKLAQASIGRQYPSSKSFPAMTLMENCIKSWKEPIQDMAESDFPSS